MRLVIDMDYPEIPEQFSSNVYALVFGLLNLIRRTCSARGSLQEDPEKAIEATIAWGRERHPEILEKTPEELAELIEQRRLSTLNH